MYYEHSVLTDSNNCLVNVLILFCTVDQIASEEILPPKVI